MAQDKLPDYAGRCMSNYYEHYAQRAMQGLDDDSELVDAVCTAQDAMPTLLPVAFAACIEEEEREALARSIEVERQRKQQAEPEAHLAGSAVGAPPTAPPQETTPGQSQPMEVSQTALPGQGIQQTVVAADGTPTTITVTSTTTTTHGQGDTSGQRPAGESQPQEQSSQRDESQSSQQQPSQEAAQEDATQSPAEQSSTQRMDHPDEPPQQEMSETDRLRQEKVDKLTRIMLESIYSNDTGITPASEIIYKVVLNFVPDLA